MPGVSNSSWRCHTLLNLFAWKGRTSPCPSLLRVAAFDARHPQNLNFFHLHLSLGFKEMSPPAFSVDEASPGRLGAVFLYI